MAPTVAVVTLLTIKKEHEDGELEGGGKIGDIGRVELPCRGGECVRRWGESALVTVLCYRENQLTCQEHSPPKTPRHPGYRIGTLPRKGLHSST